MHKGPRQRSFCVLEIFLDLCPGNGMIEILILLKCLLGQFLIHRGQASIQRSHQLHPSDFPQQLCCRLIHALVPGSQPDAEIASADF